MRVRLEFLVIPMLFFLSNAVFFGTIPVERLGANGGAVYEHGSSDQLRARDSFLIPERDNKGSEEVEKVARTRRKGGADTTKKK